MSSGSNLPPGSAGDPRGPQGWQQPPAGGSGLAPSPLVAGALAFGTALLIGELTKSDHDDRDRSDRRRRDAYFSAHPHARRTTPTDASG